jgi:RNA polymerase sigma-70 factor (ECF subfamily)
MSVDVAELAIRIAAGDRNAEEELVQRYSRGVSVLWRRATNDRFLAEDLYQETFRICVDKIRRGELREPEKLSGFICNIARNLAVESFRRASRMGKQVGIEAAESIADDRSSHFNRLLEDEKARIVRQVLDELASARDREVLYRFYVAEEDKERICEDLGLSSLHFNRVLYRARERYRELYGKYADSGGIGGDRGTPSK